MTESKTTLGRRALNALLALVLVVGLMPVISAAPAQQAYADDGITIAVGTTTFDDPSQTTVTVPVTITIPEGAASFEVFTLRFSRSSTDYALTSADLSGIGLTADNIQNVNFVFFNYQTTVTPSGSAPYAVHSGTIYLTYTVNALSDLTVSSIDTSFADADGNTWNVTKSEGGIKYNGSTVTTYNVTYPNAYGVSTSAKVQEGKTVTVDGGTPAAVTGDLTIDAPTVVPAGYQSAKGYSATTDADGNLILTTKGSDPITYSITYDLPFGATSSNPKTYTVESSDITLSAPDHVSMGTFNCWRDAEGNVVTTIPKGTTGDITLTADCTMADSDTSWYNTTDAEFTVSTPAQLYGLAKIVAGAADGIEADSFAGKTVTLGADIDTGDLSWCGIGVCEGTYAGAANFPFSGTFDGAGHTVTYKQTSYGYGGLFQMLSGATVENLRVDGSVNATGYASSAGVATVTQGNTLIKDVSCSVDLTQDKGCSAGGFVHSAWKGTVIDGCCFSGSITGMGGGFVDNGSAIIRNSVFDGTLNYNASSAFGCAGLIRQCSAGTVFESCAIYGDITNGFPVCYNDCASYATAKNVFYLDDMTESTLGTAVSAGEMKSAATLAALGDAFVAGPDGNPMLAWMDGRPYASVTTTASDLQVGDELTVDVVVRGDGVASAEGTLTFDGEAFELVSFTAAEGVSEAKVDGLGWSFFGNEADTASGITVATATLRCKAMADGAEVSAGGIVASRATSIEDVELLAGKSLSIDVMGNFKAVGDANNNGRMNVVDAQVVLDMANLKYGEGYEGLIAQLKAAGLADWNATTAKHVADYNEDGTVDATDARAIQSAIFAA